MNAVDRGVEEVENLRDPHFSDFWDGPAGDWTARRSRSRATCRFFAYACLTIGLMPIQLIGLVFWPTLASWIPRLHHRLGARLIGLRVRRIGAPVSPSTRLFVSNHVSYFDIVALGSILDAQFVAKSEVSSWPMFGLLAKLTRTVFVERRSVRSGQQVDIIGDRLDNGDSLILFPEGTSTDGSRALPFKSTLFAAVEDRKIQVQAITIAYTRLDGVPIGRALRPLYAWYGEMKLLPHLWSALSLGAVVVEIRFHAAMSSCAFASRKQLASHCHAQVASGLGIPYPEECGTA
ncbi:MAG: 1-acyl-sn-glycerol-3-phosphate acyltransferase [Rhodospirillaceae bacterium]|nr:1-acyl-sn-glycerol-3-phosphate acyltransferase [Rhodospirillaceae bacterium]